MTVTRRISEPVTPFAPGQQPDKPYLGSPSVVEGLLRDMLGEVVTLRGCRLRGETLDIRSELAQLAEHFQNTLYGGDPGFAASPWNSPTQLGRSLAGEDGEADAVKRFAGTLINRFVDAYLEFEAGRASHEQFTTAVDDLIKPAVQVLLGLPSR